MGTSEHTFNQVKAILEMLDRSIDRAREKRLDVRPNPVAAPVRDDSTADRPIGRARPLRPSGPSQGSAFQRFATEG
jgi:hypothetical protein